MSKNISSDQVTKSKFALVEEDQLKFWQKNKIFEKSLNHRIKGQRFEIYDGPPFANGQPHFGHSLVKSIKDSIGRYKTMQGYYVERKNGWDCHGLPVEFAIEKELSVSGKKQIVDLGIDKFNSACQASVFKYKGEWEKFFWRLGRWANTEHAYATIDNNYTESVWWTLQQISKKNLLYKGFKSMPYCPRCETPLSNFEVNEGYKDGISDPSLFVKFKLADEDAYVVGWTTTPWSLPGNAAIAVNPNEQYIYVEYKNDSDKTDVVVLAKNRIEILDKQDYRILKEVKGKDLVGKSYVPLFRLKDLPKNNNSSLYKIWAAEFVSVEDGTGILHVAPSFGEDDLNLSHKYNIPVLKTIDEQGRIKGNSGLDSIKGLFFKDADPLIIEHLISQGSVYAAETIQHTYPFCYRCDTPLLYYAISTWFVRVSEIKNNLLKTAESINWTPEHIKSGRFGNWLEGARDWAISRNRYWGAPMPIWVNQADENDYLVIGSIQELKDLAGEDIDVSDLHRPYIDKVEFTKDGKKYRRVEEVLDCWFESGSMPVAQQHYPFENIKKFKDSFPADYIGEGLDQTRLWFYVLHVISTILFNKPAFKNVLVNGMILAADGQKLSKRLKNYPPVEDVFNNEGADTLRLYLLSNSQAVNGDYMRFNRDSMKDLNRNVIGTLINSLHFFNMYAQIDNWHPVSKKLQTITSVNVLDEWILARLDETIEISTKNADAFKLSHAINPILELIDDMSNWYIRRSRRRFWKSEDDNDKTTAYSVLHYMLVRISQLLAPWAPFVSESMWRNLTVGLDEPESVHLSDWPIGRKPNKNIINSMKITRQIIVEGLALRAKAGIKLRQPLASASIVINTALEDEYLSIIIDELNIKNVSQSVGKEFSITLDEIITTELAIEGLARDLIRRVQETRKSYGLDVSDRINLYIEGKLTSQVLAKFSEQIKNETLCVDIKTKKLDYHKEFKIDGLTYLISISKAEKIE